MGNVGLVKNIETNKNPLNMEFKWKQGARRGRVFDRFFEARLYFLKANNSRSGPRTRQATFVPYLLDNAELHWFLLMFGREDLGSTSGISPWKCTHHTGYRYSNSQGRMAWSARQCLVESCTTLTLCTRPNCYLPQHSSTASNKIEDEKLVQKV